jgi:hypothetical protein
MINNAGLSSRAQAHILLAAKVGAAFVPQAQKAPNPSIPQFLEEAVWIGGPERVADPDQRIADRY